MQSSNPVTVSIGMPVYNGAKYLRPTLASLCGQTFTDFSLVICDDGSTDETLDICREFASRDARIRLELNPERLGGARNFNRTFELSKGKYFMWAAQDDLFHPAYIQKCLAKLEASPNAVLALAELVLINEGNQRIATQAPIDSVNIGTEGMDVVQRLHEVFRRTGWWAIYGLIRPEVLRKTKLYRNEFAGDVLLIAELLLHGEFAKVPEPLFYYRCRTKQPFSIEHNMQSIDHTKKASKTAFTGLMRSLLRCVLEFDLDTNTKKRIIDDLINTLLTENHIIRENILWENKADLLALALSCDNLHSAAIHCMNLKCAKPTAS